MLPPSSSTPDPWAPPDPSAPAPQQQWGQQQWGQQQWGQQQWGQQQWGQPWGQDPWGRPAWGAPPPPRRRRRLWLLGGLVPVLVLLLAVAGVAAWLEDRRSDRLREDVAAALPELQAFVERERGLDFLEEVDVEVLDDDDFLDALYAQDPSAAEPREDRDAERTLVALGLLDPGVDLEEAVGDSLDEGVVGFYDPADGRLAVRGRELDAFARLVLVHELTHALQDQHFDIERRDLEESDDERSLVFSSLVEGDATRVELAWFDAQPPSVQDELAALFEGGDGMPAGGEPVVEDLLGFPYYAGPGLVLSLLDSGGQPALDAAFEDPPTTTEQVVDLAAAGSPVTVEAPELVGREVDGGVLGVLGLTLLTEGDPLEPGPALAWNGDRYRTVERDGRTCTVVDITADDEAGRDELRVALDGWADRQPEATVEVRADAGLRLRACVD